MLYMYNAFCHFGRCYCTIPTETPSIPISYIKRFLHRNLEEPPIQKESDEEPDTDNGGVLPDKSLEIDVPSCFSVFRRFRAE